MATKYFLFNLSVVTLTSILLFLLSFFISPFVIKSLDSYPVGITHFDPSQIQDSEKRNLVTLDNHHSKHLNVHIRSLWAVLVLSTETVIYTNWLAYKHHRRSKYRQAGLVCIFFALQAYIFYTALDMKYQGDVVTGEYRLHLGHIIYTLFSISFTTWGIGVKHPTFRLISGLFTIIFLRSVIYLGQKMFILSWYFRSSKVVQILIRSVIQNVLKSFSIQATWWCIQFIQKDKKTGLVLILRDKLTYVMCISNLVVILTYGRIMQMTVSGFKSSVYAEVLSTLCELLSSTTLLNAKVPTDSLREKLNLTKRFLRLKVRPSEMLVLDDQDHAEKKYFCSGILLFTNLLDIITIIAVFFFLVQVPFNPTPGEVEPLETYVTVRNFLLMIFFEFIIVECTMIGLTKVMSFKINLNEVWTPFRKNSIRTLFPMIIFIVLSVSFTVFRFPVDMCVSRFDNETVTITQCP